MEEKACHDPNNALLPRYLNGSLEGADAERVQAHLDSCPVCARELEELGFLAGERQAHPPGAPGPRATLPAALRLRGIRVVLATTAVLAALLAVYWVRRETTTPAARAAQEEDVVTLDLHSGLVRGRQSTPTLVLARNVRQTNLRLVAPVNPEATYELELRSPGGAVVAHRPRSPLVLDALGRTSYRFEAALLVPPGQFELRLREFEPSGAMHEYPYSFRVVSLP